MRTRVLTNPSNNKMPAGLYSSVTFFLITLFRWFEINTFTLTDNKITRNSYAIQIEIGRYEIEICLLDWTGCFFNLWKYWILMKNCVKILPDPPQPTKMSRCVTLYVSSPYGTSWIHTWPWRWYTHHSLQNKQNQCALCYTLLSRYPESNRISGEGLFSFIFVYIHDSFEHRLSA